MGERTAISWCHHTFNVWWGCVHAPAEPGADQDDISEECRNCYAESFDRRVGGEHWGATAPRRFFGDAYSNKPLRWNSQANRLGKRARVFCSSMADWAERHADPEINARMDAERAKLWRLIRETPWLDWLLLTKRAERLPDLLPWMSRPVNDGGRYMDHEQLLEISQPWPNVWVGVTAGTRRSLWRVYKLREVSAAVRFVSCEPLLEHITDEDWDDALRGGYYAVPEEHRVHWLIVGDESGRRRRPARPEWIETARDAAERHGVAFHFKQWNGPTDSVIHSQRGIVTKGGKIHLPLLRGIRHDATPAPADPGQNGARR